MTQVQCIDENRPKDFHIVHTLFIGSVGLKCLEGLRNRSALQVLEWVQRCFYNAGCLYCISFSVMPQLRSISSKQSLEYRVMGVYILPLLLGYQSLFGNHDLPVSLPIRQCYKTTLIIPDMFFHCLPCRIRIMTANSINDFFMGFYCFVSQFSISHMNKQRNRG